MAIILVVVAILFLSFTHYTAYKKGLVDGVAGAKSEYQALLKNKKKK